jgi:hypothetical protein
VIQMQTLEQLREELGKLGVKAVVSNQ